MVHGRVIWQVVKESLIEWRRDNVSRLAAALSFYTIFSLAPALIIIIAVVSAVIGGSAARAEILSRIQNLVGSDRAEFILSLSDQANREVSATWGTLVGLGLLLMGATIFYVQFRNSLNAIWNVKPKSGHGLKKLLYARVLAFGMVLGTGLLLLVSVAANTVLTAVRETFADYLLDPPILLNLAALAAGFALMTFLFAMIYKLLPEVEIAWGDVWTGAAITSLLFSIGNLLIGLYLGRSSVGSVYGAAGSLVMVLLWVYYSLQTTLLGAEFTKVYARRFGSRSNPNRNEVRTGSEVRSSRDEE